MSRHQRPRVQSKDKEDLTLMGRVGRGPVGFLRHLLAYSLHFLREKKIKLCEF